MTEKHTHTLYCPNCKKTVEIPFTTEIAERTCPVCKGSTETLWPSKAMYERDVRRAHSE